MSSQLGLEISHQQIKAVMISRHKKTPRIHKTAVVDIKADASFTAQRDALNEMRRLINYKNQPTVLALPHDEAIIKTLSLDTSLTDDEIMRHIETQALTLLGHPANEMAIDFVPLSDTPKEQQHLQIVAAKKSDVDPIVSLCRQCRIALKAIDTRVFALARTLTLLNLDRGSHQCIALLTLEKNGSLFIVIENTRPIYTTTLDTNDGIVAFHRAHQLFHNAEPDKKIHGIVFMGAEKQLAYSPQQFTQETGLPTSMATVDKHYLATPDFDPHLFTSLGAALWK